MAASAAVMIAALIFAGVVGGEAMRLVAQTAPLWLLVALGMRGGGFARWAAIPLLGFWIACAGLIWADRLGYVRVGGGHFSPVEARVALVVAGAGLVGLAACFAPQQRISALSGLTLALACGALQIGAFYLGMQPQLGV
jgi:hypothetical protein